MKNIFRLRKKIIIHLLFTLLTWSCIMKVIHYMEDVSPLMKAISEISLVDYYFSKLPKNDSSDIYIIDVGELDSEDVRKNISSFLEEVNSKYSPKAIGVDIFFDKSFEDENDHHLETQLSSYNIVRYCEINEVENVEYINPSELNLDFDFNNSDGYTNSIGDPSLHPCVRYFLPQKIINGNKYSDFSLLLSKKSHPEKFKKFIENNETTTKKLINYNVKFDKNIINIRDTSRYHELKNKILIIGICTKNQDNLPKYTEDTWFTPKNNYSIGRSQKDSYGIEIRATILSNIINEDFKSSNPIISKLINLILSFIAYFILLCLYLIFKESFVFIKVFSQTIVILLLSVINIIILNYTSFYIDFSPSLVVLFFGPEIVEFLEEITHKYNLESRIDFVLEKVNKFTNKTASK